MNSSRFTSNFAAAGALAALLGTLALSAFAGPGPQYWSAPRSMMTPKTAAVAACSGCKTTVTTQYRDRGPAGKGVAGSSVAGSKHECGRCTGAIMTANNAVKDTMTHDSAQCAMVTCCK